jgi:hypothetical protein
MPKLRFYEKVENQSSLTTRTPRNQRDRQENRDDKKDLAEATKERQRGRASIPSCGPLGKNRRFPEFGAGDHGQLSFDFGQFRQAPGERYLAG